MTSMTRRDGLRLLFAAGAAGAVGAFASSALASAPLRARVPGRVAVIGSGVGARALNAYLHTANIRLDAIGPDDPALGIDWVQKRVITRTRAVAFDSLVLSPGVAYRGDVGLPMAWRDAESEKAITAKVLTMNEGGTVLIRVPRRPYRFIAGPYIRAERLAAILAYVNPRAKILIFDANADFPGRARRLAYWRENFGTMLEWIPAMHGGAIYGRGGVQGALGGTERDGRGVVVDYIPDQEAAPIVRDAGLCDTSGWGPVDPRTGRSVLRRDAYILGDAASWPGAPKTAAQARKDAKVAARDLLGALS